jgi:hypothetical protein
VGSFAAIVHYTSSLVIRQRVRKTFLNNLTGPFMPDKWTLDIKSGDKRSVTSRHMPIIRVDDLSDARGDQVALDSLDRIYGAPIVDDDIAGDKAVTPIWQRDSVYITQYRKSVSAGGRMSQQRNIHNARENALELSIDYMGDFADNLAQIHMFGARGSDNGGGWMILANDPNFARIMRNPVLPPVPARYFGTTSAVTDPSFVSTTNVLNLNFFDDMRTYVQTGPVPLAGIRLQGPDGKYFEGEESPLLMSIISEEAWNQLMKDTSAQNWRTFLSNATERLSWTKHPLFRSLNCGMWNDILIVKAPRAVLFNPGDSVQVSDAQGNISNVIAQVRMHRGVLVGAGALGSAYAAAKRWPAQEFTVGSGGGQLPAPAMNLPFTWEEELTDGKNMLKVYTGFVGGIKKLRYPFVVNGSSTATQLFDNAVVTFDTFVPPLRAS